MKTEMGEYIVGAYLTMIKGCDFIDYNVKKPGGKIPGLDELDVIGLDFKTKSAYLCEVATHIDGLLIGGGYTATVNKIRDKYRKQREYGKQYLKDFPNRHFMFWSPVVPKGKLTSELNKIQHEGLEIVINKDYANAIDQLRKTANVATQLVNNPAFRMLQILEHLRRD